MRILIGFLSPGITRAVSNTYTIMHSIIEQASSDIFVDYSYFPSKGDFELYGKYRLTIWFGNVSKRPAHEYDLVIVSSSILVEVINLLHALPGSGIAPYYKDRVGHATPFIMAGGIPVVDHDGWGGNGGIPDLVYAGYAEGQFQKMLIGALSNGFDWRHETKKIIKYFVGAYDSVYFPGGYDVEYQDHLI